MTRRTHRRRTQRRKTHRRKTHRRKTMKKHGGAATAFPLNFFKADAPSPTGSAGNNLTGSYGNIVRAPLKVVGGYKKAILRRIKTIRKRGGFVPTVMEGFTQLAAKYITPLALFAGYKLMKNRTKTRNSRK